MLEKIDKEDWANSVWLAVVLLIGAILVVAGIFWGISVSSNIVAAEKDLEDDTSDLVTPDVDPVVFQVANATTKKGYGAEATNILVNADFVKVGAINASREMRNERTSYVYYQKGREDAVLMANLLGINEDQVQPFPEDFELEGVKDSAQVLIILGPDANF